MSLFSDLEEIPTEPGVYLIKDKEDHINEMEGMIKKHMAV